MMLRSETQILASHSAPWWTFLRHHSNDQSSFQHGNDMLWFVTHSGVWFYFCSFLGINGQMLGKRRSLLVVLILYEDKQKWASQSLAELSSCKDEVIVMNSCHPNLSLSVANPALKTNPSANVRTFLPF